MTAGWLLVVAVARASEEAAGSAAEAAPPPEVVAPEVVAPEVVAPEVVAPEVVAVLVTDRLRVVDGDPWSIEDDAGHRYTTVQFARRVGDKAGLRRLEDRQAMARVGQAGVAGGGAALLLSGLIVAFSNGGAPSVLDYRVDPGDYQTGEEYDEASDFQRDQYDKSIDAWQAQKLGSSAFLLGAGGLFLATAPFVGRDAFEAEERPHLLYDRAEAEALVARGNEPRPPAGLPPPSPAGGGGQERGPVPAEEEGVPPPGEAVPGGEGEAVPDEPQLRLSPVLAPGFLGLRGVF